MNPIECSALQRLMNHLTRDCREAYDRLAQLEGLPHIGRGESLNHHHARRQQSYIVLKQAESQLEYAMCAVVSGGPQEDAHEFD